MYFLNENNGTVELMAILSNPSATDITVQITISDVTTISKYAHTHMHTHIHTHVHTCIHKHTHINTHIHYVQTAITKYISKPVFLQAYPQIHVCS